MPHNRAYIKLHISYGAFIIHSIISKRPFYFTFSKAFADFDVVLFFYEGGGAPLREVLHPGQYKRIAIITGSEGGFSVEEAAAAVVFALS